MKKEIIDLSYGHLEGVFDIEEYCNDNNINILNVIELSLDNNGLSDIKNLHKAKNLVSVVCSNNNIKELKGIDNIINLQEIITDDFVKIC